jgi:hypothetical protein
MSDLQHERLTALAVELRLTARECQLFCVRGFRDRLVFFQGHRAAPGKRSPNWMANCPIAAVHSIPRRHRRPAFLIAR